MQNKNPFEIILHVGQVTSLQSWVAKNHVTVKPLFINECSISYYPSNSKGNTKPYDLYLENFQTSHREQWFHFRYNVIAK